MKDQKFQSLLYDLVRYLNKHSYGFASTKLIKLAYLVELEYYRSFGERATDVEWVYFKYGPYVMNYKDYLTGPLGVIKDDDRPFHRITISDNCDCAPSDRKTTIIIERVIAEFGDYALGDLLDYVYFETEPMMAANKRTDIIDFSVALSKQEARVKEIVIDENVYQGILDKLKKKVSGEQAL